MKKVLAVLLCLVMCLTSVSVLAYEDLKDIEATDDIPVVDLVSALGIMEGFDDGTFRPEDTLTRAEAAAIMVRLLGMENEAVQGETNFDDVDLNHWASGYINIAEEKGVINGLGDGTFNPEGEVTYHQMVKMLVCLLGYEPVALANGGWIGGGYLYSGSSQVTGITKGVPGEWEEAITRLSAAKMVYRSLEVEMMNQDSFTSGLYGSCWPQPEETLLTDYLKCEKIDGVMTAFDEKGIEIIITKNYCEDYEINYQSGEKYVFENRDRDADRLLGYTMIAYVKKDGGKDVFFIGTEKVGKNNITTVDVDLIKEFASEKLVYYKDAETKEAIECELQSFVEIRNFEPIEVECNVIVNGELAPGFDVYKEYKNLDEITFLDNDNDEKFEFVIVETKE